MPLSRDEIEVLATSRYGRDENYDTVAESLFALLVDVAAAYEAAITPDENDKGPLSLGERAFLSYRKSMLLGLEENLDMLDERRADGGDSD